MSDVRTPVEDLPKHLQPPEPEVVASHAGPDGLMWELKNGRFLDPSHLLRFARENKRVPDRSEWLEMIEKRGADTKEAARYTREASDG